jgi:hypothetical protein
VLRFIVFPNTYSGNVVMVDFDISIFLRDLQLLNSCVPIDVNGAANDVKL